MTNYATAMMDAFQQLMMSGQEEANRQIKAAFPGEEDETTVTDLDLGNGTEQWLFKDAQKSPASIYLSPLSQKETSANVLMRLHRNRLALALAGAKSRPAVVSRLIALLDRKVLASMEVERFSARRKYRLKTGVFENFDTKLGHGSIKPSDGGNSLPVRASRFHRLSIETIEPGEAISFTVKSDGTALIRSVLRKRITASQK
jgi:cold shock CspA family protein